jgi:hypothetical protein
VSRDKATLYPDEQYPQEGGIMPELIEMIASQESVAIKRSEESAFEMKQSTMPDAAESPEQVFESVRPNMVLPEASTNAVHSDDVLTEYTLGKLSDMTIKMSHQFEEQFISRYLPRIFPFVLNYNCGGPEYPDLFGDWGNAGPDNNRWRRNHGEAFLSPGSHAQMLATRPEGQLGGDWMLVPAARTLHWRYTVLRNSFVTCKRKICPEESLVQDLSKLIKAAKSIFQRMQKKNIVVAGISRPLKGDVSLIYKADDVTAEEQAILRGTLSATKNVSGCQALRRRIGHILFGFRVVYGESLFWTISPSFAQFKHSFFLTILVERNLIPFGEGRKINE